MKTTLPLFISAAIAFLVLTSNLLAASPNRLPREQRTNGDEIIKAIRPATEATACSVVQILDSDDHLIALGTIVSDSGHLVTKLSEIPDRPLVLLPDQTTVEAEITGRHQELDLALMKVSTPHCQPVSWVTPSEVSLGEWVTAAGQQNRLWIGNVSTQPRPIQPAGGAMGIGLSPGRDDQEQGAWVAEVYPDSAAESAGIQSRDVILAINDIPTPSSDVLIETVRKFNPGEEIQVQLRREGIEKTLPLTLGYRSIFDPFDRNQRMSGETSKRRTGFQEVIPHTIPLTPNAMGGPLLNLQGEVIGINIARADRVTTYALPTHLVQKAVDRLVQASQTTLDEESKSEETIPQSGETPIIP